VGAKRLLVVEGDQARLYDLQQRKVSDGIYISRADRLQRAAQLAAPAPRNRVAPAALAAPDPPPEPVADDISPPFYRRWWFWTAVGALAAGAGVITYVAVTRDGDPTLVCCQ